MRIWPFFAVVTAGLLIAAINMFVSGEGVASRWVTFGLGLGVLLFGAVTWLVARGDVSALYFDRNGPVAPAGLPPEGTTWSFDQYAGALATLVAPEEGLVYAYPKRQVLRIILHPRSTIALRLRVAGDDSSRLVSNYETSWMTVRVDPGSAPRFLNSRGTVGARIDDTGRLVPVWRPGFGSRASTERALAEANGYAGTVFGMADYGWARTQAIELAAEAGWALPPKGPTAEERERAARRSDRAFVVVPAVVAGLCVVAAIIALLAGAPWWVALIVVGGGLFFAAVFAIPLLLIRAMSASMGQRSRRMPGDPIV